MAKLPDVRKVEELEAWLRTQPREVSLAVAARALLRVLPLKSRNYVGGFRIDQTEQMDILRSLRSASLAWTWAMHPRSAEVVRPVTQDVAQFAFVEIGLKSFGTFAAREVAYAAHNATRMASSSAAASAVFASAFHADDGPLESLIHPGNATSNKWDRKSARPEYDLALVADCGLIEVEGRDASYLCTEPLWGHSTPRHFGGRWRGMKSLLIGADQYWDVWTRWYDAILEGRPTPGGEELDVFRVLLNGEEDWEQGPAHINALIKAKEVEIDIRRALAESERDGLRFRFFDGLLRLFGGNGLASPTSNQARINAQLPIVRDLAGKLEKRIAELAAPDDLMLGALRDFKDCVAQEIQQVDPYTLYARSLVLRGQIEAVTPQPGGKRSSNFGLLPGEIAMAKSIATISDLIVQATPEGAALFKDADAAAGDAGYLETLRAAEVELLELLARGTELIDASAIKLLKQLSQIGEGFEFPIRLRFFVSSSVRNVTLSVVGLAAATYFVGPFLAQSALALFLFDKLTGNGISESEIGKFLSARTRKAIDDVTRDVLILNEDVIRKAAGNRPSWKPILDMLDRLKEREKLPPR